MQKLVSLTALRPRAVRRRHAKGESTGMKANIRSDPIGAYDISLKVTDVSNTGAFLLGSVSGQRTNKIGASLWATVVTAQSRSTAEEAQPELFYAYDLTFTPVESGNPFGTLATPGIWTKPGQPLGNELSYPEWIPSIVLALQGLPGFTLPTSEVADLRLPHGSRRKLHANSLDALALLEGNPVHGVPQIAFRPQQLFLTGDQIYADGRRRSIGPLAGGGDASCATTSSAGGRCWRPASRTAGVRSSGFCAPAARPVGGKLSPPLKWGDKLVFFVDLEGFEFNPDERERMLSRLAGLSAIDSNQCKTRVVFQ